MGVLSVTADTGIDIDRPRRTARRSLYRFHTMKTTIALILLNLFAQALLGTAPSDDHDDHDHDDHDHDHDDSGPSMLYIYIGIAVAILLLSAIYYVLTSGRKGAKIAAAD